MRSVEVVVLLVALATVVAAFATRLRVPAPSLLVVVGVGAGLIPGLPLVHVPPQVVSLVVLPPLLYAASEELAWRDLKAVWRPVVVLAIGLVAASAAAVAAVAAAVTSLPASMAFLLGAVLASTDPVAVSSLARRLALPAKVQALVQGESLFNDASSLVLFQVAAAIAVSGPGGHSATGTWLHGAVQFAALTGGGLLAGAVVAAGAIAVRRQITDPVLETVTALITPYAAFLAGAALHVSGVTAVIVTGLAVGAWRPRITTAQTRLQVHAVYQTLIFMLEGVVFSLIGLQLPALTRPLNGTAQWLVPALAVAATLMLTRIAWVFPLWSAAQWRRTRRPDWAVPAVVSWAGTRGVVPLAAALSIPLTTIDGDALPQRDLVLVVAAAVVVLTLIVQGLTLGPLARAAGFRQPAGPGHDETIGRIKMAEAALARLDELAEAGLAPDLVTDQLRAGLEARIASQPAGQGGSPPAASPGQLTERQLRRELLLAENAELTRLAQAGTVSSAARQKLQHSLDLKLAPHADAPDQ